MRVLATALLLAGLSAAARAGEVTPVAPYYLCYDVRAAGRVEDAPTALDVTDRFGTRRLAVERAAALCREARMGAAVAAGTAADAGLMGYSAELAHTRPRQPRAGGAAVDVTNRFGTTRVRTKALARLLEPAALAPGAGHGVTSPSDPATPLSCWTVKAHGHRTARRTLSVGDTAGEPIFAVGRPTRLCVADDDRELLCYAARLARTRPLAQPALTPETVAAATALGTETVRLRRVTELCVPSLRSTSPPPPPPPPSPPASTLEVSPATLSVVAGERPSFTATARFTAGGSADVTRQVLWQSSDQQVALDGSVAGAFVDPVGPGTTTVSVLDPATGVSSNDPGGSNAVLTVTWPLERLTIAPHAVTKRPGDHESYTVTGWFTGGFTRNLTQRVVYTSSNTFVAAAPNTPGNRSRIDALAAGTSTIAATDPISGLKTTDSGDDATLHVAGALSYILLQSNATWYEPAIFPGESHHLTAIGYYPDGSRKNLTQRCVWSSSDPSVAAASNPDGDRSRIDGISPGTTSISCTDSITGTHAAYPISLYVLGDLVRIEATGDVYPQLEIGEARGMTAFGVYTPFDYPYGPRRNLTPQVVWTSRDPDIVTATNEPGYPSKVVAVAGGTARVYATDPVSGLTSNDVDVSVLGDLVGLELLGATSSPNLIGIGVLRGFEVRGDFQGGSLRLSQFDPLSYVFESSDPSVVAVEPNGHFVRGVAVGSATITARHLATGITSPGVTLVVQGPLTRIILTPTTVRRGIGETETFTALGWYPPGQTYLMTQQLVYTSSDPGVVVATNQTGNKSLVTTVGAGTATISATDPGTGVSTTATGDDATVEVLPGTLDRITIQPSSTVLVPGRSFDFTAIGHYPNGDTINETQQVTWTSFAPAIADAPNDKGERSRVDAGVPGTATISARHPSGVSSHDTGDDATVVVQNLTTVTLTPATRTGHVGDTVRFTVTGTLSDASTLNLTQHACYFTDDFGIALAPGLDGDRSAVQFIAPGTTTLHAVAEPCHIADYLFHHATASLTVEP
jgi:uncharacterized protein YjdB